MNLKQLESFIHEVTDEGYILNLWEPMMKEWTISSTRQVLTEHDKEDQIDFERFISKMMEMERACMEEKDQRPTVIMRKDFRECKVELQKANGEVWVYILQPYGYQGTWEIFRVDRKKKGF
ncbi:hypothetical protein [Tepidibacillus sp. HK-1]|uniref:hypothetical protein n=1 Tax=Tepidibacillus sp. HK-1 TaxID=1883407 RepID=UPI000852A918|nr:hypothetical protein [Tepidibacillus sp. HK-1]GBF10288.1 hypothetical protein HK1_00300 [Tepidibacillus sp. HK-1]